MPTIYTDNAARAPVVGEATPMQEEDLSLRDVPRTVKISMQDGQQANEALSRLYSLFMEVQNAYGERDEVLQEIDDFFQGFHWETEAQEDSDDLQITLNYTKLSILKHIGYLTGTQPRVDVPHWASKNRGAASKREAYLRYVLDKQLWPIWAEKVEWDANKFGFAVIRVLWDIKKANRKYKEVKGAEGSTRQIEYRNLPWDIMCVRPTNFYPVYRTFEKPDDFLAVFRYDPDRLVEDVEEKYGVKLQTMGNAPGSRGTCDLVECWTDDEYILFASTQYIEENESTGQSHLNRTIVVVHQEKHSYGRPPFFVLVNYGDPHKDPTQDGSISDVQLVEDANRHLNLVYSLTAQEIVRRIHPPITYKAGADGSHRHSPSDIRMGAGEVIPIGDEEELEAVKWDGVPQTVRDHTADTLRAMEDFSAQPHTAMAGEEAASGVGMRLAYANLELALVLKIPRRVATFERLFTWMLQITYNKLEENGLLRMPTGTLLKADIDEEYSCMVKYGYLLPRDKIEYEQHVAYLFKLELISMRTALEWLEDVEDPDAEMELLKKEKQDAVLNPESVMLQAQAKQAQQEAAGAEQQQSQSQPQPGAGGGPVQTGTGPFAGMGQGGDLSGVKNNAAPPVPQSPAMPTGRNVPFLNRGQAPNYSQAVGPSGTGYQGRYKGPPMEEQG